MPSIITHAATAIAASHAFPRARDTDGRISWKFMSVAILCAALPDADVLGFSLGIQYEDMLGHRGLSHSLSIAILVGLLAAQFTSGNGQQKLLPLWGFFSAVTASHGFFDALTSGGHGIAFFAPLSNERYFFPWRPIRVSPFGISAFISARGIRVLASEVVWIWIPIGILAVLIRRHQAQVITRADVTS